MKRFRARMMRFERDKGWHYVSVPTELTKALLPLADRGLIAVQAEVGGIAWRTSLLPMGDGTHFLALPQKVRQGAGLQLGDWVEVSFAARTQS